MRISRIALVAFVSMVVAGCAAERPSGVPEYYSGQRQAARAIYEDGIKADRSSRALYTLRLATLELDEGDLNGARERFAKAAGVMQNFKAEGEFKALVGSESSKEYKGDPYEQMMAFWYAGLLYYMSGDYNMAFPYFRAAAIADGGTAEERYQADAASVLIMLAKTEAARGEDLRARDEYKRAAAVHTFRQTVDRVSSALFVGRDDVPATAANADATDVAYELVSEGVSAGATQEQDPVKALAAAREFAFESLQKAAESRRGKERLQGQDPNVVSGCIKELVAAAEKHLSPLVGVPRESPLDALVRNVSDPSNNFFVVVGLGKGPFKSRAGEYGEMAKINQADYADTAAEVYVDGRMVGSSATVEDVYYQASTRGGRAMDGVLKGKAVFKTVTKIGAAVALAEAATTDSRRKRENALIVGGALLAMSVLTQPEADIRSWETLPDKIQMLAAKVPPGGHTVEVRFVGGSSWRFENVQFSDKDETILYVRSGGGGAWTCPSLRPL